MSLTSCPFRSPRSLYLRGIGLTTLALVTAALLGSTSTSSEPVTASGSTVGPSRGAPLGAAVVTPAVTAYGAGAATTDHPISTAGRGYSLESPTLIGETGLGLRVYVDAHAPQRSAIASAAASSVSVLRGLGLNVTWGGYGTPAAAEGIVAISEGMRGCVGAANRIANTFPYLMVLPNGDRYMFRSEIVICPRLYTLPSWQWNVTVRHELGHAMGLDHTNYTYAGGYQLMNAANHLRTTTYQAGDIAGLRTLARNAARVRSEVAPIGRLEDSHWNADSTITLQGWSLLMYYPNEPVSVTIRDNDSLVSRTVTTLLRPDVNHAHGATSTSRHGFAVSVPWTAGDHSFCVTVSSSKVAVAHASLGCAAWNS